MLRQHHHRRVRPPAADLQCRLQALGGLGRGHPDVREHHIGPQAIECLATLASASQTTKYAVASITGGNLSGGTSVMVVTTGERSTSA